MARYYGYVGYAYQEEVRPSVWRDVVKERQYYGESIERSYRYQSVPDQVNKDLVLNTDFEIIADGFAIDHWSNIRYIVYGNARWEVVSVNYKRPRIHLRIGGIYHGPTPEDGSNSSQV